MYQIIEESIGKAWISLINLVECEGTELTNEGKELLNVALQFKHTQGELDWILEEYADQEMIDNMGFVFFGRGEDKLGHSYKDLMVGPLGRNDFSDVVELLRTKQECKRATMTFKPKGTGKVPCINVVNFLIRNDAVEVNYFARGQDAYKKFFADAVAIAEMQNLVSEQLGVSNGTITGFIASAHNYYADSEKYNTLIKAIQ
jgi:thymidylate synthase